MTRSRFSAPVETWARASPGRSWPTRLRAPLRRTEPQGHRLMAELSVTATELEPALRGAEVVVFAVPDAIVRDIAADVVPKLGDRGSRDVKTIASGTANTTTSAPRNAGSSSGVVTPSSAMSRRPCGLSSPKRSSYAGGAGGARVMRRAMFPPAPRMVTADADSLRVRAR